MHVSYSSVFYVIFITSSYFSDSDCLRFAFMHIIKREIEQVALEWNNHSIRHSSYAVVPNGTPEELFFMPSILGIISTSTSYL